MFCITWFLYVSVVNGKCEANSFLHIDLSSNGRTGSDGGVICSKWTNRRSATEIRIKFWNITEQMQSLLFSGACSSCSHFVLSLWTTLYNNLRHYDDQHFAPPKQNSFPCSVWLQSATNAKINILSFIFYKQRTITLHIIRIQFKCSDILRFLYILSVCVTKEYPKYLNHSRLL